MSDTLAQGINLAYLTQAHALTLRLQAAPTLTLGDVTLAEDADPALVELQATTRKLLRTLDTLEALCVELLAATDDAEALALARRVNFECRTVRDLSTRHLELLPALRTPGEAPPGARN